MYTCFLFFSVTFISLFFRFEVKYDTKAPWSVMPNGFGSSLELMCYNATNLSDPSIWRASPVPGIPSLIFPLLKSFLLSFYSFPFRLLPLSSFFPIFYFSSTLLLPLLCSISLSILFYFLLFYFSLLLCPLLFFTLSLVHLHSLTISFLFQRTQILTSSLVVPQESATLG